MPYWIRGRDNQTGKPTDPFFSDSDDEAAARAEATTQGMVVESVVRHIDELQAQDKPQTDEPANPLFSNSDNGHAAPAEVTTQGRDVESFLRFIDKLKAEKNLQLEHNSSPAPPRHRLQQMLVTFVLLVGMVGVLLVARFTYCHWRTSFEIAKLRNTQDVAVRSKAMRTLGELGPVAVPALLDVLNDKNITSGHIYAGSALRDIFGGNSSSWPFQNISQHKVTKTVVPVLIEALKNENPMYVVQALGELGPAANEAIAPLTELLKPRKCPNCGKNHLDKLHEAAAIALWKIGKQPDEVVPILIEALKWEGKYRGSEPPPVVCALAEIGPDVAGAILAQRLNSEDPLVREQSAEALGKLGPIGKPAALALAEALSDNDVMVRRWAATSLIKIGPAAKEAVPALIEALKDQDDRIRWRAVIALGAIGTEAKDAFPALNKTMADSRVREAVAWAMQEINHNVDIKL